MNLTLGCFIKLLAKANDKRAIFKIDYSKKDQQDAKKALKRLKEECPTAYKEAKRQVKELKKLVNYYPPGTDNYNQAMQHYNSCVNRPVRGLRPKFTAEEMRRPAHIKVSYAAQSPQTV